MRLIMAKNPSKANKVKTSTDIDLEMQKIQQDIEAQNARLEELQQQRRKVLAAAKCSFYDVIVDGAAQDPELAKTLIALGEKTTGAKKQELAGLVQQLRDSIPSAQDNNDNEQAQQKDQPQQNEQSLTQEEIEDREFEKMLAEEEAKNTPANSEQPQHHAS